MVKKRRSLQAIFVPSFLQGGALSLSPTLLSPTSPSVALPPSPTPPTSANSFKQRARAHSAAAGKAARVLGEEALDAYVSLRSGFSGNAASVSGPSSAGIVHDAAQVRPVSPPSTPSRRKPSISSIIQAIPSFSSGITGISLDADADAPPTTPVQMSPISSAVKGPRASPPPSYLIDDDPFANLSGAPSEVVIRSSSGASGSSSAANMLPPLAPSIPPSPLKSGAGSTSAYVKGKARSGSLSVPSSPPAITPGFSHLPPPPHSAHSQHHSPRAFGSRGHPRPATQRPAFSSRPSLPSLNTLANMNIVLNRKPRKGKVGAGLPFEPWDNVDTPPDSAIDPLAPPPSISSLSASSTSLFPSPLATGSATHSTISNETASHTTTSLPTSLDLQPPRPTLKPLLPSQILAMGSMASEMEMSMVYESPVVPPPSAVSPSVSTISPAPTSATSTSSSMSSTSTITPNAIHASTYSGPPQLPPLSLDFIIHPSFQGEDGGEGLNENGDETKSLLEREFEAAVSPLSAEGEGFGFGGRSASMERSSHEETWTRVDESEVEETDEATIESRWEEEERGRRQSVIAIGAFYRKEGDLLGMEEPAMFATRQQLEEEVQQLPLTEHAPEGVVVDVFSTNDLDAHVQSMQTEIPSYPTESVSTYGYGYGYGYGYNPQQGVLLGSPAPPDSYQSYSSHHDVHPYPYPDSTPLFSPPPSDWSRSRSLSSTSLSSIDEDLDLDFSALKRLSDESERRETQGVVDEHQNFNILSGLQCSPDVSIRSPAISANQFNHGAYENEKEKRHSPNLLGDEHHLGLSVDSFFSRTRSSSFTPSIGSSSQHHSSSQHSENLGSSDEFGTHASSAGLYVDLQLPHAHQALLASDVVVNDGGRDVCGEERIGLSAEWAAGKYSRGEMVTSAVEGVGAIIEYDAGTADMPGTTEGDVERVFSEVVEDERENDEVNPGGGSAGSRPASTSLLRDDEALALLQAQQGIEEDEAILNLEHRLMFGTGMNAHRGAGDDTARDDNNGIGHNMLDGHSNKLNHLHEGILLAVSPTTTTISPDPSTLPSASTTAESHDITTPNLSQEYQSRSGSELVQSRCLEDNNNTQLIPVLGLIASESQDHHPETAVDGASDSNINQLQLQPSSQDSLLLAPYPSRASSFTSHSSHRYQSQSPSPSASSVTSPRLQSQYFSANSSASVSPRSSASFREGDYLHPSPDFSELEPMNRGTSSGHVSDGMEGYSYGGGATGGYNSSSRGGSSQGYYQSSSSSRTAYRGYASTGYPGSGGGGGMGGNGGDDREEEERRRRKLAEMGYVSRSTSRKYKDATSGEEDEETRVYGGSGRVPLVPAIPKSSVSSSSMQRYASTGAPTTFPVTSSSSRSTSDYDSDSSDDDVPLAQRIPGALKAQNTIRRQVKEEKEKRKHRREVGRESGAQDDYRLRQDTLKPAVASTSGAYAMGGGLSSSQEAALLAASSVAASSAKPSHLREHPGRRQRTMTLPSKAADSTAPSSFNADDLVI
ncbi:hypothetical protein BJ165DRAFT_742330 [Panaeolus papilionaceus]|nr:hypothetical protein BJ165DRAFT_742330 [Panaeolus papilionaceus]